MNALHARLAGEAWGIFFFSALSAARWVGSWLSFLSFLSVIGARGFAILMWIYSHPFALLPGVLDSIVRLAVFPFLWEGAWGIAMLVWAYSHPLTLLHGRSWLPPFRSLVLDRSRFYSIAFPVTPL